MPNWQDIHDHVHACNALSMRTRRDYCVNIRRLLAIEQVNGLSALEAEARQFEMKYPLSGFDPQHHKSESAYKAWRRKLLAACRLYETTDTASDDALDDDWAELITHARSLHGETNRTDYELIPVKSLAKAACQCGIGPGELGETALGEIAEATAPRRHKHFRKALSELDRLRHAAPASELAEILAGLPLTWPLASGQRDFKYPEPLQREVAAWISAHCDGVYEPISGTVTGAKSSSTIGVYHAAFGKYLETACLNGFIDDDSSMAQALAAPVFHPTMRALIDAEQIAGRPVSNGTLASYTCYIGLLAEENGIDVSHMQTARRNNPNLRAGTAEQDRMTDDSMRFCLLLLTNEKIRTIFQTLHLRLRHECEKLRRADDSMPYEQDRILSLGIAAAFAAFENCLKPVRIHNVAAMTIGGTAPWLIMPRRRTDEARLHIPAGQAKNRKAIKARTAQRKTGELDVLEWYIAQIRPLLSAEAAASPYLFPTADGTDHVAPSRIRGAFMKHARAVGIRMKPHYFRHGRVSLYLDEYPEDFAHAAKLLDDDVDTVRRHYAFINDEKLLEKAQRTLLNKAGFNSNGEWEDP